MNHPFFGPHYQYDAFKESFVPVTGGAVEDPYASSYDDALHSSAIHRSPDHVARPSLHVATRVDHHHAPLHSEQSTSGDRRPEGYIRRPRNAFMIFRSEFWATEKINKTVEHDHRHISRIIAHYWNKMSEDEKQVWRVKADEEKMEHLRKNPGYRFKPTTRNKKPVKRRVKRNGEDDMERCRRVADLLRAGKEGEDLANAVKATERNPTSESQWEDMLQAAECEASMSRSALATPSPFPSPGVLQESTEWNHKFSLERPMSLSPFEPYNHLKTPSSVSPLTESPSIKSQSSSSTSGDASQGHPLDFFYPYSPSEGLPTSAIRSGFQHPYIDTAARSNQDHNAPNGDIYCHSETFSWANLPLNLSFDDSPVQGPYRVVPLRSETNLHTPTPLVPTASTSSSSTSNSNISGSSSFPLHVYTGTLSGPTVRRSPRIHSDVHANDLYSNIGDTLQLAQDTNYGPVSGPRYHRQSSQTYIGSSSSGVVPSNSSDVADSQRL